MKSPLIILFIIFNMLTINMVSASNMYDEEMTQSHLLQTQEDSDLGTCIDESACDHFCHISSHMLGFIDQTAQPSIIDTTLIYSAVDEQITSYILTPPFQPPKS